MGCSAITSRWVFVVYVFQKQFAHTVMSILSRQVKGGLPTPSRRILVPYFGHYQDANGKMSLAGRQVEWCDSVYI